MPNDLFGAFIETNPYVGGHTEPASPDARVIANSNKAIAYEIRLLHATIAAHGDDNDA